MKKTINFTLILLSTMSVFNLIGQTKSKHEKTEGPIYTIVDTQPEFPGGQKALFEWIGNNLKYPEAARKQKLEGTVIAEFVVSRSGNIIEQKVIKDGVGQGASESVLTMLGSMPKWEPGKKDQQAVNVKYTLPIKFKL